MITTIRVLIVDDAVMVRSRLSKILSADPEIEVAGVAATGQIALAKVAQLKPDVVILDVEMPDLDGLQILSRIRQNNLHLPVIMFSAMTTRGATATLDALTLGASDYVTKPNHLENGSNPAQYLQDTLIPKIKALSQKTIQKTASLRSDAASATVFSDPPSNPTLTTVAMVAIGVSTGGPNALATLLAEVPPDFPVPILIVQHMPPMFTRLLAERLTTKCALPVREAIGGAPVCPGTIWIAPGDYHLTVKPTGSTVQFAVEQTLPRNSCRPSVDVLFESVAQVYGEQTLGIILTGMGQDGLQGCRQIRDRHGQILAQDEATSVVWGMPRFVAEAGLADAVLPLDQIMPEILRRVSCTAAGRGGKA